MTAARVELALALRSKSGRALVLISRRAPAWANAQTEDGIGAAHSNVSLLLWGSRGRN